MAIRLTPKEIEIISEAVYGFDKNAGIILYGSRTDESKKGGDIDLLVLSDKISYESRRKIKVELINKLGDRKIDLIVSADPYKNPFTLYAFKHGVKL